MSALTRRAFTASAPLVLAAFAQPSLAQQARARPLVIAHRGASGERPEHTLTAYQRAIDQGCDFIEPDLVMTADGVLVARHENEISGTTDVAERPDFASRRTERSIDGVKTAGWFTEDFTLTELKTLRAKERLPALRPASAAFDGAEPIPTFQEVVDLATAQSRRTGRTIGVYPEMKHPTYFEARGLAMGARLAAELRDNDLDRRDAPVFVQCFEPRPLRAFRQISAAPSVMLAGAGTLSDTMLAELAEFADGLGPELKMVLHLDQPSLPPTGLIARAQGAGFKVHPWTVRLENSFLPATLRRGEDPAAHGDAETLFRALFAAGADGVFTDFPEAAVKVREAMVSG
ncbi:MAG: glycerophosphodiester phosphodiesterase family protein [Phenylobacterium sp.]|uniref:glycerophosphodiester phosphodiesterase family protein n=1 Tax=Phenylobacterium sp. TaxID=1871053 RepID=UPI00271C6D6C|nr:glycerophosphodiester phosphodiesterase family protein [Phenylobacterium sp.]MDO8409322.1 glycerophosphodiester phosphodiesterase family protein [Phenylobacterium sp.]